MTWTEARKKAFIVSVLRAGTRKYPPKYEVLNEAKTEKKVNTNTGRIAQHYKCAMCLNDFPAKNVQVDHIIPIIGPSGFTDWNDYVERIYCAKENLQVLCLTCHDQKTKHEREQASLFKRILREEQGNN